MSIITLEEAQSTNTWVSKNESRLEDMTVVRAVAQTAGRGQRGNSWESEPGANLTFSILTRPQYFPATAQFYVSEAVALGVVDALADHGIEATVKWPNDIYVGDCKIAGILIEHAVAGRYILHSILGVGLNVNQREFLSDAPNPVSMRQLLGRETDLEQLVQEVSERISARLFRCGDDQHAEYVSLLWRGDGQFHTFSLPDGSRFEAAITAVAPDGTLHLLDTDGCTRSFAFKEVAFVL